MLFTDPSTRRRNARVLGLLIILSVILLFVASTREQIHLPIHPPDRPKVDNTQSFGKNKVSYSKVEFLGFQNSDNSCSRRDLGFTGKLGKHWYAIHGDALWCAQGISDPNGDIAYFGMVRNTISLMTDNVLMPHDLYLDGRKPVQHPQQFFPTRTDWGENALFGYGGTSICAVDDTTGIVFYAVNHPLDGIIGAGVAKVELTDGHNVTVTKRYGDKGMWWDTRNTPRYGDIAAYRDDKSDYIYALGGAPTDVTAFIGQLYVFQARVLAKDAFDLSKYEYWHGRQAGWRKEPLATFDEETAMMWNAGQGQIVWNAHYECYIFVHTEPGTNRVVLKTAESPGGPWSEDLVVYSTKVADDEGQVYAGVAHPYLDESGKTLTITYTNHPNNIEAIKVTFK